MGLAVFSFWICLSFKCVGICLKIVSSIEKFALFRTIRTKFAPKNLSFMHSTQADLEE